MRFKFIIISELNNGKYNISFEEESGDKYAGLFTNSNFIRDQHDPGKINLIDTLYIYLLNLKKLSISETEILVLEGLLITFKDFNDDVLNIGNSNNNISLVIQGLGMITTGGLSSFEISEKIKVERVFFISTTDIKSIRIGSGKDIKIGGISDSIILKEGVLDKSDITLYGKTKELLIGEGLNLFGKSKTLGGDGLNLTLWEFLAESIHTDQSIKQLKFGRIYLHHSKILGGIISDCVMDSLESKNSIIKDVLLFNITFPIKENFYLYRSIFENCGYSNVSWNDGISDKSGPNEEIKETYRMLKHEYDSIGNKTEANKFFAKEMEYYEKSLNWKNDYSKKLVAFLQRKTSNFGNDWVRAFIVYMVFITFGFICFQFYQVLWQDFIFDFSRNGFYRGVEEFTRLANPIPKVEEIKNIFSLLFSIFKILIVYQIVVALRRISQR